MDEKVRYKRLVFIIIALVVLSLFLTACILMSQTKGVDIEEKREWFFEESIQTEKEVHLDNAYILKGTNKANEMAVTTSALITGIRLTAESIPLTRFFE